MSRARVLLLALCCLAVPLAEAGCGGSSSGGGSTAPPAEPTASAADFPKGQGKTLGDLASGLQEGPIFAPSVRQIHIGPNRVGFALFDVSRKQLDAQEVAVYTARTDGSGVRGPFVARKESIGVAPQYQSRTTQSDLANGDKFYVADVPFSRRGGQVVTALARMDGRLVIASPSELKVLKRSKLDPPNVGDKAIRVHTKTGADVGGDYAKISTRVPPAKEMQAVDFADVLGKKPVVLIFATPQLCASRVCGPVVDIAEQVRAQQGDGVAFIHQEVYTNNDPNQGYQQPLAAYHLTSEPWIFVIDRHGIVRSRFEGAVSTGELARAVQQVKQG